MKNKRLTRNQDNFWGKDNYKGEKYIIGSDGVTSRQMCLNKLGELEDLLEKYAIPDLEYLEKCIRYHDKYGELEEQLGCPLDVLGKALIQNCFYDVYGNKIETDIGYINQEGTTGIVMSIQEWENGNYCGEDWTMYLKDYKKTWWLREDKSE